MKCPSCDKGTLKEGKTSERMYGITLGTFPALVCDRCQESFTDKETTAKIEEQAKKKGVWGLGLKVTITKSGNSLAVRIPKKLADYLGLKPGKEGVIHPEGKNLLIELEG